MHIINNMDENSFPADSIVLTAPKNKSGAVVKIIVGVIVLSLAGAGIVLAARIWDPLWNPFRPSPEKVIDQMTEKMKAVKTMRFDVKIDVNNTVENIGVSSVLMAINGGSNMTDSENVKTTADLDLIIGSQGANFPLSVKTISSKEDFYLKMDEVPPILLFLLASRGIDTNQIQGQWIKIGTEKLVEGKTGQELSKEKQQEMLKKLQNLLKGKNLYSAKEMPDDKIGEEKTYHYALLLNKEEIKKLTPELIKIIMESSGQSLPGGNEIGTAFLIGGITESFNKFLDVIGEISIDLWVGKKDLLVYRVKGEKEIDLSQIDKKTEGKVMIKTEMNYSDFNQPVEIEVPENYKLLEEIFPPLNTPK